MNNIEEITFSRFRNNDYFQFMTDLNTQIVKATPAALNLESLYPEFSAALSALNTVFKVDGGSILTGLIGGGDTLRDKTWSALKMRIRATLMCPIEREVEAAEKLKRVFDLYGNVRQLSLVEESAALNNLVEDLEQEDRAALCATIGITRWVAALKEQNTQVQELMRQRRTESANKASGDVKAAREAMDPIYAKMVARLNALVELDMATPEIELFIVLLNKQIREFKDILATRQGRLDSDNEGQNDVPPVSEVD